MGREADYWIEKLGLAEHPEGGCYRETYRAPGRIPGQTETHPAGRSFSTAIYYLLRSGEVSRFHRLRSDEVFHFYRGSALVNHVIDPTGRYSSVTVGADPDRGEVLQTVVPAGCWFGSTVGTPDSFALVGCTVAPGFDFGDFDLGDRKRLARSYPEHRAIIERLT